MSSDDDRPSFDRPSRRHIEPPPGLDPFVARFIEELAREAVRGKYRTAASVGWIDMMGRK
jgi:hypothetical protein